MRSFLVLVGFAVGIIGYAIVYDGAAAIANPTVQQGGVNIDPLPGIPNPHIHFGGHDVKTTSRAFPWGRPGIINSLIPGRVGQGSFAPNALPNTGQSGSQVLPQVRYV